VDQVDLELQLKVWKELAVGKQIMMNAACEGLGIDPDSSADELKLALNAAIKRAIEADANIAEAQEHAKSAVGLMEKKVADSVKSVALAEAAKEAALAAQQRAEQLTLTAREAHDKEMKNIKAQLIEKDKTLKAINKALADTPENVIKKLKTLKKQKDEESAARQLVSNEVATLRKDKRTQDQRIITLKAVVEQGGKLVTQHRELHAQCEAMHDQLKALPDSAELTAVPALDVQLLEGIEQAVKNEEK
jgi:hypothetical protein